MNGRKFCNCAFPNYIQSPSKFWYVFKAQCKHPWIHLKPFLRKLLSNPCLQLVLHKIGLRIWSPSFHWHLYGIYKVLFILSCSPWRSQKYVAYPLSLSQSDGEVSLWSLTHLECDKHHLQNHWEQIMRAWDQRTQSLCFEWSFCSFFFFKEAKYQFIPFIRSLVKNPSSLKVAQNIH